MRLFFHNKSNRVWLFIIIGLMLFNLWYIIEIAPLNPEQVWSQKIMYVHVPSAWVGFLSYFIVMIAGIMFFVKGDDRWDDVGLAAAEIGTIFMFLVLVTGPIWATQAWGQAWSWEPRLTTTLILFLIYIGYFMMRSFGGHAERVKRYAASIGIIAFADVPIIYFSVDMWASYLQSHPPRTTIADSDSTVQMAFFFSLFTFTFLYYLMLKYRVHVIRIKNRIVDNV